MRIAMGIADMTWIAALGYLASALVFAAFWMTAPIRLRQFSIAANVAFFSYGILAHSYPVAVLHALLFPLNIVRLVQIRRLMARVEAALSNDLSPDWLRPFTKARDFPAGAYVFRHGDEGDEAYFIVSGQVRLPEIGVVIDRGALLGEMALFTPGKRRNLTAHCITDVQTLAIDNDVLSRLYYQNPDFAVYLLRLITSRLVSDLDIIRGRDRGLDGTAQRSDIAGEVAP